MDNKIYKYLDEKFKISHVTCPKCKVDLKSNKVNIDVPTESGTKSMGADVTSCPKCGFIGDVEPLR